MANAIDLTTLLDGQNLVLLVNVLGDGSGEETGTVLVDRSDYAPTDGTELVVEKIEGYSGAFTMALSFDATTDLVFVRMPASDQYCWDWHKIGGISSNRAGAGANGDILITTDSLGNGDAATFIIHMRKS